MRAGLLQEPIFQKFQIEAGNLMRGLVSCTGAQFCGIAMIETKNRVRIGNNVIFPRDKPEDSLHQIVREDNIF